VIDFLIFEKSISRPARNIIKIRPNEEKKSNNALDGIIFSNDFPIIIPIISSMTITGMCVYRAIIGAVVIARNIIINVSVIGSIAIVDRYLYF